MFFKKSILSKLCFSDEVIVTAKSLDILMCIYTWYIYVYMHMYVYSILGRGVVPFAVLCILEFLVYIETHYVKVSLLQPATCTFRATRVRIGVSERGLEKGYGWGLKMPPNETA
ncbi:hypothetical protein ACFX2C_006775 [Malus domestica]